MQVIAEAGVNADGDAAGWTSSGSTGTCLTPDETAELDEHRPF
jgi:hypothetical protein